MRKFVVFWTLTIVVGIALFCYGAVTGSPIAGAFSTLLLGGGMVAGLSWICDMQKAIIDREFEQRQKRFTR